MNQQELKSMGLFALKTLVTTLVVLLTLRLFSPLPAFQVKNRNTDFFVNAEASSFVTPDIGVVTLGVRVNAPTAKDAADRANETINKVTEEVKKLGVESKNIRTTEFNVYPEYGSPVLPQEGRPEPVTDIAPAPNGRITSYTANISITVKEKDTNKLNQIIDTGTANGANQIGGVTFEAEDREKALDEAREEAIRLAKEKAEKIAKQSGVRLGKVINVSEYSNPGHPVGLGAAKEMSSDAVRNTQLEPGQTEVRVNVTLTYETL